jgi:hypothetical protein
VQIGRGLMNGGPASLFLAFTLWYVYGFNVGVGKTRLSTYRCSVILAVTLSETTLYNPYATSFPSATKLSQSAFFTSPKQLLFLVEW